MKPSGMVQRTTTIFAALSEWAKTDGVATHASGIDLDALIEKREELKHSKWAILMLAYCSLGVIYGDIGTSPLYAFSSIFLPIPNPTEKDVLGGISLVFWALTLVVLVKYVLIVLHANDHGEGGTFALYARICRTVGISTTNSMNEVEHANLLRTAAVAGEINRATKLARESRGIAKMFKLGWMFTEHLHQPNQNNEQKHLDSAAVGAVARSTHSHAGGPVAQRKTGLVHKWAFPADVIRGFLKESAVARGMLLVVSVLGTAMVVGDGVLTPAISVVSAVQGLAIKTEVSQEVIIGISAAILVGFFVLRSLGNHRVWFFFPPVVVMWMLLIFGIGTHNLSM